MERPFQCYSWWGEKALSAFWEGACDLQTQHRERTGTLWCPVLRVAPASSACGRCSSVPSACRRLAELLGFSLYSVAFPSSLASIQSFYDEAWCRCFSFVAHPLPNPEQKDRLPWLQWKRCSFPVPWASGLCIPWRVWGCPCEESVCVDSPNALISSERTMPLLSRRLLWGLAWKSASRGWKLRASVGCKLILFLWAWSVFSQPYLAWLWWRGYLVPPELLWAFNIQLCAGLSDVQGEQVPFPCLPPFFGFLCASKLIFFNKPTPSLKPLCIHFYLDGNNTKICRPLPF